MGRGGDDGGRCRGLVVGVSLVWEALTGQSCYGFFFFFFFFFFGQPIHTRKVKVGQSTEKKTYYTIYIRKNETKECGMVRVRVRVRVRG